MIKKIKKFPKVSVILNLNNGGTTLNKCLEYLFSQEYPLNKIEVVIVNGGYKETTKKIVEKYLKKYPKNFKMVLNPKKYKLGKGMGADLGSREATGEMILLIDPDNLLVQKNWLRDMVDILLKNEKISAVQSRLFVPKNASSIDKYFGAIGIEDPFAIPYSLSAQITFNPRKFKYDTLQKFFIYSVNKCE